MIERVLGETGLAPSLLELELTESMLMHHAEETVTILTRLDEMGVHLAIDDFGTGYSSLSYLKRFPIHSLKIDRSFVRDISTDPDDAAIVTAIVAMARSLNLSVTAEGVETEEQAEFLRSLACHQAQGYYFGRPMPAADFAARLGSVIVTPSSLRAAA
jgi:EAL domain-containing protein (putative c-di-GMP-specific phosphodiesterase class I)